MQFVFRHELGKMTPRIASGAKIYVFGAGTNWEFLCKEFKFLVDCNIDDHIDGFIDNDINKQGTVFHGKPVYALSDIDTANDIILVSILSTSANQEILAQLLPYEMYESNAVFNIGWDFDILARYAYECLLQFKDRHKGERCFIIGNGPSLLASDLDELKNEVTFATNKIYLLFEKTQWRPSYYICQDHRVFTKTQGEIAANIRCTAFYPRSTILGLDNFNLSNFYFYLFDWYAYWKPDRKPAFSEEPFEIQFGATVTYDCLQFAAYMGFSEIYLIGIDNTYNLMVKRNGEILNGGGAKHDHFVSDYVQVPNPYQVDIVTSAYETAREYCESRNIKIRNATRGGNLEVFERVDFDSLFSK